MKKNISAENKNSFVSGVFVLSFSTLIVKIIGLAFKIPMLSLLGMEGMGYFNSAYEIYAVLCVIATAGLPVALSLLISSARANNDLPRVKEIYRSAIKIFLIFGILGTALMLFFARKLADLIGNSDAYFCILAIAPALLFICLASAIRGYCQGFEDMRPTAISQLIEAISKLVLGVAFAIVGIKMGFTIPIIAALAVLGITVGTLLSACYLSIVGRRHRVELSEPEVSSKKRHRSTLLKIALPITLGSAVLSLTRVLDMGLIMRRLQDVGVSQMRANEIYGAYTTLALPVFSLIPSLITPISMALIPELAGAIERKNSVGQMRSVEKSLRLTSILAMPASVAIMLFSRQILSLLFSGQTEAVDIAAPLLSVLGASILFSCLITTTNAILQSYRCVRLPIFSMAVGVVVKAATTYFLLGVDDVYAIGAPIGSLACNVTVVLLNFAFIIKYTKNTENALKLGKTFIKPFLSSILSVGSAYALFLLLESRNLSESLSFAISALLAVILYCIFVFLFGLMEREDLRMLPLVGRLIKDK